MKQVNLQIDGKQIIADEGKTILQAAREGGIEIPTLCHDERLAPYGACRICSVEIKKGGNRESWFPAFTRWRKGWW